MKTLDRTEYALLATIALGVLGTCGMVWQNVYLTMCLTSCFLPCVLAEGLSRPRSTLRSVVMLLGIALGIAASAQLFIHWDNFYDVGGTDRLHPLMFSMTGSAACMIFLVRKKRQVNSTPQLA